MARVIPKDELKSCGTGWLEWSPKDERDYDTKDPYEGLIGVAWFNWYSIEVDGHDTVGMGHLNPGMLYGVRGGWRIWDEKPTIDDRKLVGWNIDIGMLAEDIENKLELSSGKHGVDFITVSMEEARAIVEALRTYRRRWKENKDV